MKIGEPWKVQSVEGSPESKKSGAKRPDADFAALLQDELSGTDETSSNKKISELNQVLPTAGISGVTGDTRLSDLMEKIDGVISKLQSFEQALQTNASPKQVDQIVKEMGEAADKLQSTAEGASGYAGLDDVTQEINVAAYMESVKWRRGDYL